PPDTPDTVDVSDQDTSETSDTADTADTAECNPGCGANQVCEQGMCICTPGFGDCDATADNGCEQSLDTVAHCGLCNTEGQGCDRPGVRQVCTPPPTLPGVGSCEGCIEGHFDLDGSAATGCETGLVLQAQSDLSANLPGTVVDVAVD